MAGRVAMDLDATEIVDAAIDLLREQGLDAVSMRNVGARLGVSPVPVYSRIGNKDALLEAMAGRLMEGMAPDLEHGESWADYSRRWAEAVRRTFATTAELRLVLGNPRAPFVEASRPLVHVLRDQGFDADEAVQATRLLLWTVVGFSTVAGSRSITADARRSGGRPGGDPSGVTGAETDELFALQIGYVIDGIATDHAASNARR